MAGGTGRRFIADIEKPLLNINGRPIIDVILDSLVKLIQDKIIDKIVVCTTKNTPTTERYLLNCATKNREYLDVLDVVRTGGVGYIEDLHECIQYLSIKDPFLYLPADIPLFNPDILRYVISVYQHVEEDALAVFMIKEIYDKYKIKTDLALKYNKKMIVPTGINILHGAYMNDEQEEYMMILGQKDIEKIPSLVCLAFNINYIDNYMQFIRIYKQNNRAFTE